MQGKNIAEKNNYENDLDKDEKINELHYGFVNKSVVVLLSYISILTLLGGAGYATFKFTELEYKSILEYVGLVIVWIGVISFIVGVVYIILKQPEYFTRSIGVLHHYAKDVYYLILFTVFAFFVVMLLILYSNVTGTEPLSIEYERHCPVINGSQTTDSIPTKSPEDY